MQLKNNKTTVIQFIVVFYLYSREFEIICPEKRQNGKLTYTLPNGIIIKKSKTVPKIYNFIELKIMKNKLNCQLIFEFLIYGSFSLFFSIKIKICFYNKLIKFVEK